MERGIAATDEDKAGLGDDGALHARGAQFLRKLDALQRRVGAKTGVIAERDVPSDFAFVEIDGGEVAVGRFQQRQTVVKDGVGLAFANVIGVGIGSARAARGRVYFGKAGKCGEVR